MLRLCGDQVCVRGLSYCHLRVSLQTYQPLLCCTFKLINSNHDSLIISYDLHTHLRASDVRVHSTHIIHNNLVYHMNNTY